MKSLRAISILSMSILTLSGVFANAQDRYGVGAVGDADRQGRIAGDRDRERERICEDERNRYLDICRGFGRPSDPNPPRYEEPPRYRPNPPPYQPNPPSYPPPPPAPQPPPYQPPYDNGPGYGNGTTSRTGYVGRQVMNEMILLRDLIAAGPELNGAIVESVVVELGGGDYGSKIQLLDGNGGVLDQAFQNYGTVVLRGNSSSRLDDYGNDLMLFVEGRITVQRVTVNFILNGGGWVQPGQPREVAVRISVPSRVYGQNRLDLLSQLDQYRLRGFRVVSVELSANAVYRQALADIFVNGSSVGQTANMDVYNRLYIFNVGTWAVVGQNLSSLILQTQGDSAINSVVVRLSRR